MIALSELPGTPLGDQLAGLLQLPLALLVQTNTVARAGPAWRAR